jgi:hypothetical protein
VRIDPAGEVCLWQGFSVNNGRGHRNQQLPANVSSFVTCGQRTRLSGTLDAIQMLLHIQSTLTEHIGLTQLLSVRK